MKLEEIIEQQLELPLDDKRHRHQATRGVDVPEEQLQDVKDVYFSSLKRSDPDTALRNAYSKARKLEWSKPFFMKFMKRYHKK